MSNWAEDMLENVERDIKNLELLEEKEKDEFKTKQYRSMKKGLQKQCLDLYRYALKEGTPFDVERLKRYESYHQPKKLYLSDPQLEERKLSPIMRTKSAEEEMIATIEEEKPKKTNRTVMDLSFLSKRQRETIQLYADGLTYSDIGEIIGIQKGTVSKHLQLARSKAKEQLAYTVQLELTMEDTEEIDSTKKTSKKQSKTENASATDDDEHEQQMEFELKVQRSRKRNKK